MVISLEQQVGTAYARCMPLVEKTTEFLSGLMIGIRPVVLGLADKPTPAGENRQEYTVVRPTNLEILPTRVTQLTLSDEHEPGSKLKDATILTSEIEVDTETWGGRGENHSSVLTWGFAESTILDADGYTWGGVGSNQPDYRSRIDMYREPEVLEAEYAAAYVTRTAGGLLVAQMVHGFSVANGGNSLDIAHIEAQAAELAASWAVIDEFASQGAWGPIQEIQSAL